MAFPKNNKSFAVELHVCLNNFRYAKMLLCSINVRMILSVDKFELKI